MTEKSLNDVEYNYQFICEQIEKAAQAVSKTRKDITFLAATKTVEVGIINHAISLGLNHIGENRVQELLSKYDDYNLDNCSLQFIGHLQTNKVRQIVGKVDMIQSVDSLHLAKEISKQSQQRSITTDILIEINIGKEENKSGVYPEELEQLLYSCASLENIRVQGLMSIPPICENKQKIRKIFQKMHNLFIDISDKKIDNINMRILSMGMSGDYTEAILEGANMVRIGSALFGERIYR